MQLERRNYRRKDLDFYIHIRGENLLGKPFEEKTRLLNISGGGAQFISSANNNYFMDQELEASVVLPGTREVKGCLNTTATVIRLSNGVVEDPSAQDGILRISVKFKKHFKLKRT